MQTDWAEENLQVIRTLMERSAVYRRALAPVMGLVGLTGLAAGAVGAAHDFETSRRFATYWAVIAFICLGEATVLIRRQALKDSEPFWSPPTRRVAQAVAPAFFSGLMVGIVFFIVNLPDLGFRSLIGSHFLDGFILNVPESGFVKLVIPIWMVLYGLAMHAAGFFMPRGVRIFGWGYILAGFAYLGYWTYDIITGNQPEVVPFGNANIAMGALFGGGHAAYGLYLWFTEKRGNVV